MKSKSLFKRVTSTLLATALVFMSIPITSYANSNNNDEEINKLLDLRAQLICSEEYDQLDDIEYQLQALGVETLTTNEVREKVTGTSDIMPYVLAPSRDNISWHSYRSYYYVNGTPYEIQTLVAQANSLDSDLKLEGYATVCSNSSFSAGFTEALSVLALTGFGSISKGASLAVTVYDTAQGFFNGFSKTTVITEAAIQYAYSHVTTVMFKYVKPKGQSDDYQELTYIATKGTTEIGYQYATFEYSGGNIEPGIIQGTYSLDSVPSGYNDNAKAVNVYCNSLDTLELYIDTIQIKGLEGKNVCTFYPITPSGPWNIM